MAHRVISHARNDEVAFGGEADINGWAGLGGSVAEQTHPDISVGSVLYRTTQSRSLTAVIDYGFPA
jgi:hypothetical protein